MTLIKKKHNYLLKFKDQNVLLKLTEILRLIIIMFLNKVLRVKN